MIVKQDQERVKELFKETITQLAKSGLNYNKNFIIEGLIGITIDEEEIFLINLKEAFDISDCRNKNNSDCFEDDKSSLYNMNMHHSLDSKGDNQENYLNLFEGVNDGNFLKVENDIELYTSDKISSSFRKVKPKKYWKRSAKIIDKVKFKKNAKPVIGYISSNKNSHETVQDVNAYENTSESLKCNYNDSLDDDKKLQIKQEIDDDYAEDDVNMIIEEAGSSVPKFEGTIYETIQTSLKYYLKNDGSKKKFKVYTCPICGMTKNEIREIKGHLSSSHGFPKEHTCHTCNMSFSYKSGLIRHSRKLHLITE